MRAALLSTLVAGAAGHGAVTIPPSRNAIDGDIAPWSGNVPWPIPFDKPNWCAHPSAAAAGKDPRNLTGANGQACFWFSNGCDIGSSACDGDTGQVLDNNRFIYTGEGDPPSWGSQGIVPDPKTAGKTAGYHYRDPRFRPKFLKYPERNATLPCELRTLNTGSECGGIHDYWYYAPWRSPGIAPVIDSCGVAGGRLPHTGEGSAGATYVNTTHAKLADKGSALKPAPSGTVWTAGSVVEVAWTQKAWHGGGYQYRIAPASGPLTEEVFQKTPLDYVGNSSLRWGGVGGEQIFFKGGDVGGDLVTPKGSTWRQCPLPRGPWDWHLNGASFEPKCEEPPACRNAHSRNPGSGNLAATCRCSGDGIGDLATLEIVDYVRIPKDLPAGEYVLGWRWDCEESTQVWASCSDVTIKK